MTSFDRVGDAYTRGLRESAGGFPVAVRMAYAAVVCLLAPLEGCARGVRFQELDSSTSGVVLSDAGVPDADDALTPEAAVPALDAAIIDQGETKAPDAATKDSGASETAQCAATNLCVSPSAGGTLSGDTGTDMLEVTGSTSTFVLISVSEDDHTPLVPKRLRVAANLNSPGADFDLFLHSDGCASVIDSSEGGFTESVDLTWEDTQGQDSGRKLILEVRHKTGACDAARPWVLSFRGN